MATTKKLMGTTAAASGAGLAIEDVFSTYLYTGNSSTQTITNGIDLAGEGGMVWIKERDYGFDNNLYDTDRGATKWLVSNSTNAQSTVSTSLTSFNSDGFSVGSYPSVNEGGTGYTGYPLTYASWTFRKAPRFFDVVTYTGDGTSGLRYINHNLESTPAFIIVKCTSQGSQWFCYHKNLTSLNYYILLNGTSAQGNSGVQCWDVSDTQFAVHSGVAGNASGQTYVAYLFAHDPLGPSGDGSDGLISCGSFTTDSGGNASVDLGWEPQWLLVKQSDVAGDWRIIDNMRGWTNGNGFQYVKANASDAEAAWASGVLPPSATGFSGSYPPLNGLGTYIYIAIRRGPMRQPESGSEVFAIDQDKASGSLFQSGFPVDMSIWTRRATVVDNWVNTRLLGADDLRTNLTDANSSFAWMKFDHMNGVESSFGSPNISWMFRRAPGFFDVVAYGGNNTLGRSLPHNLGVTPELVIIKRRDGADSWVVANSNTSQALYLMYDWAANSGLWDSRFGSSAAFTDTVVTLGNTSNAYINESGNYIAYLFASLAGISKVGSYTGNGTNQTIDCGFTSGARFVLIKRTDSTGDWYVWDTARGIVSANDPHLSLNTTAAEVTTDDSIDPDNSGFIVNQNTATNINVSSASYIFYAVA